MFSYQATFLWSRSGFPESIDPSSYGYLSPYRWLCLCVETFCRMHDEDSICCQSVYFLCMTIPFRCFFLKKEQNLNVLQSRVGTLGSKILIFWLFFKTIELHIQNKEKLTNSNQLQKSEWYYTWTCILTLEIQLISIHIFFVLISKDS